MNAVPKPDFGGHESPSHGHADPNLTHAVELVAMMGLNKMVRTIASPSPLPSPERRAIAGRSVWDLAAACMHAGRSGGLCDAAARSEDQPCRMHALL